MDIDNIVSILKEKGFFRDKNGNVMIYNNNGGFNEVQKPLFPNVLMNGYLSTADANEYWMEIYNKLPSFPNREYNNYFNYLELSKKEDVDAVVEVFMDAQYRQNDLMKHETGELTINDKSNYIQALINNDVFITPRRELYQYDKDNRTFIPVNEDNIGDIIDCSNKDIADKVLFYGRNSVQLVNLFNMVERFADAKNTDDLKQSFELDYNYITNLIGNFLI